MCCAASHSYPTVSCGQRHTQGLISWAASQPHPHYISSSLIVDIIDLRSPVSKTTSTKNIYNTNNDDNKDKMVSETAHQPIYCSKIKVSRFNSNNYITCLKSRWNVFISGCPCLYRMRTTFLLPLARMLEAFYRAIKAVNQSLLNDPWFLTCFTGSDTVVAAHCAHMALLSVAYLHNLRLSGLWIHFETMLLRC